MDERMDDGKRASGADDTLRELATRLLAFRFAAMEDEEESPQLLVGELPPGLPLALPVPEGARILGAFVGSQTIIVLDAGPRRGGGAHLLHGADGGARLGRAGPHGWRTRRLHAFFRAAEHYGEFRAGRGRTGDHGDGGWAPDDHSTIQITFYPDGNGFVSRQQRMQHRDIMSLVLPTIRPPKRAQQTQQGGSGSLDAVTALARLECDLEWAAVAPHYRAELERGGWQLVESGTAGPAAWSTWGFRDEEGAEWSAALITPDRPGRGDVAHNYALQLLAERAPEPRTEETGRRGRVTVASSLHMTGGWTTMGPIRGRQRHRVP